MNKCLTGVLMLFFAAGLFAQKPSINEITGDDIRLFEMKFSEKKLSNADKRMGSVKTLLGFRHHLSSVRETAYFSLYVEVDKDTINWKNNMTLEGSRNRNDENPKIYQIKTTREDRGGAASFFSGGRELYRLDIINSDAKDLMDFYRNNMDTSQGVYYFTLRERNAVLQMQVSTSNFHAFFKALADPPVQKDKGMDEKIKQELQKPYDLLERYPATSKAE